MTSLGRMDSRFAQTPSPRRGTLSRTHCLLLSALVSVLGAITFARAEDAAVVDYRWPNVTDFLHQLIDKLGAPIRVYRIEFDRAGKVDLWLQSNQRPDLIDSYEYADGAMRGPIPVKFDHYPTVDALDYHVVELTEIDFQRLPGMLARARQELKMPQSDLWRIQLERGDSSGFLSYTNIPIWTLHLQNPRHDGSVEFDLGGKVLNVDKE